MTTPQFKDWFGPSLVTETGEAGGQPLVVYHGTGADFHTFSKDLVGSKHVDVCADWGDPESVTDNTAFYFTDDLKTATWYAKSSAKKNTPRAGANVMPVYLSLRNPLIVDFQGEGIEYLAEELEKAKKAGHDGVIARNYDDGSVSTHYIAFRPEQIKSAIGNNGDFNADNQDIRFSMPEAAPQDDFWSNVIRDPAKSGAPQVVFHGTPKGDIAFEKRERGIYFTSSPKLAEGYTYGNFMRGGKNPAIYPAYLSMGNPLVIDAYGKRNDNIPVPWAEWKPKVFGNLPKAAVSVEAAFARALADGHDGLIVRNVVDSNAIDERTKGDVYVVAGPNQIISTIGNNSDLNGQNEEDVQQDAPTP